MAEKEGFKNASHSSCSATESQGFQYPPSHHSLIKQFTELFYLTVRAFRRVRILFDKTKKVSTKVFTFLWRRKRDSNPRAGESRPNGLANRPLRPTWVFLRIIKIILLVKKSGGEGEIRTHGPYESLVFKTSSLNHSDTSPCQRIIV